MPFKSKFNSHRRPEAELQKKNEISKITDIFAESIAFDDSQPWSLILISIFTD